MPNPSNHLAGFRPNWMGFLILGLVLGASLYGAYRVYKLTRLEHKNAPDSREYEGIGGWLILVLIGMVIRGFTTGKTAYITCTLICDLTKLNPLIEVGSPRYNAFWYPTLLFEACGSVIFVVASILSFILMFKKKFTYPFVMIGILTGAFIFQIVDHMLASQITSIAHTTNDFVVLMFRLTIYGAIWIPYFLVSKRVQQTFLY